jgi:hypothetical protein
MARERRKVERRGGVGAGGRRRGCVVDVALELPKLLSGQIISRARAKR